MTVDAGATQGRLREDTQSADGDTASVDGVENEQWASTDGETLGEPSLENRGGDEKTVKSIRRREHNRDGRFDRQQRDDSTREVVGFTGVDDSEDEPHTRQESRGEPREGDVEAFRASSRSEE